MPSFRYETKRLAAWRDRNLLYTFRGQSYPTHNIRVLSKVLYTLTVIVWRSLNEYE